MQEDKIIIEVEVNAGESAEQLANVRSRMDALKDAQKTLKKEMKDLQSAQLAGGKITEQDAQLLAQLNQQYATNQRELKELTAEEKMYTNQIGLATQGDVDLTQSITVLGQQLAALKAQYRSLNKEQRESAAGQEMLKNIQSLDEAMKEADYSMGDFQRNVGNYASALMGLNGNVLGVANLFQGGFKNGIKAAGQSVKSFSKTLLATPVGQISAAIRILLNVFSMLRDAFKKNDDAGTSLSAALAKLNPIVNAIKEAFVKLVGVIANVVGWMTKVATTIIDKFVPGYKAAAEAEAELVKETDLLEQAERDHSEASAERANRRAKLEDEARNNSNLTTQERINNIRKALELERQDMEESRAIAKRKYEAAKKEAERIGDTSDETMKKISDLRVAYLNSETEFINGTRKLQKQLSSFEKELDDEEKKRQEERKRRWEEAKQRRQEAAKTELEELRKLEDMQTSMIKDEMERRRKEVNIRYTREIEDLEKRLNEEKNLTEAAVEAIKKEIDLLRRKNDEELNNLTVERIQKETDAILKERRRAEDLNNELIEDEYERRRAQISTNYAREIGDLQHRLDTETDMTLEQRMYIGQQIEALQKKQDEDLENARKDHFRRMYELATQQLENSLQNALNKAFGNVVETTETQLKYAENALYRLKEMEDGTWKDMYDNEEAYKAAVIKAEADVLQAREQASQAFISQTKEVADVMHNVTGALSDLFEAAAGDSETYEKFKKAMAIVDATISLAQTIAAATAISASEGDAYTMAIRIAANVAAVTAQFAAVIKSIKAASVPSAPAFAGGGIVPGSSYTGDKVPIRANSREMVLNLEQQQHLFDLITRGFPTTSIDYDRMAAAFAEGAERMPSPTLVYREFKRFERDVAMSEAKVSR